MRPAPTLPARHRCDGIGDVPRLHALLHQIVGHGHMHAGVLAVREQDGDRALVARAEHVHHETDLIVVLEGGIGDVQLHVSPALHVPRFPFSASRLQQFFHALLELTVCVEQLLDPVHEVLGLRPQHARRLLELPFELADQRIRPGPRHRLDAAHPGRGARLVREPEQGDLTRGGNVRPPTQLDGHARHVYDAHDIAVLLGEERHRTRRDGLLVFHLTRGDQRTAPRRFSRRLILPPTPLLASTLLPPPAPCPSPVRPTRRRTDSPATPPPPRRSPAGSGAHRSRPAWYRSRPTSAWPWASRCATRRRASRGRRPSPRPLPCSAPAPRASGYVACPAPARTRRRPPSGRPARGGMRRGPEPRPSFEG